MPDSFGPDVRSRIMSKIRDRNTKPEKRVRSFIHLNGLRFRLNRKDLPGKPDIILPKYNTIIFVNGCFWHQHQDSSCPHTGIPQSRKEYWQKKLNNTVVRDAANRKKLEKLGWHVEVVWECQLNDETLMQLVCRIKERNPK